MDMGYVHFDKKCRGNLWLNGKVRYGETYDTIVSARDFHMDHYGPLANESASRPGAVRVTGLDASTIPR